MNEEKLSQDQIDALLQAVSAGEAVENLIETEIVATEHKFKEYDFHRPEKFGNEHLQSIRTLIFNFVKKSTQYISSRIRLPLSVDDAVVQQVSFVSEYSSVMPKDYYLLCVVDLGMPQLGEIIIELDLAFAIYIHECLSGGSTKRHFKERRPLSQFETLTLDNIFMKFLESLEESFASVAPIQPRLIDRETDPNLLKGITANDMMALVSVDVKSEYWITTVRIGIPFFSVESIMSKLENVVESTVDKKKRFNEEIESEIKQVHTNLEVSLGSIKVTLDDIQAIELGDVLPLHTKVTDSLKGFVEGKHKFDCHLGKIGNKKAVMFKNYISE